jgi:hypothetical protein
MRRKPRATTHAALETNYRRRPYWRGAPRVSMVSLDPELLPAARSARALEHQLSALLGKRVEVTILRTSSTVLRRIARRDGTLNARIHEIFLGAPEPVLNAVVGWVRKPSRRLGVTLDGFVRENVDRLRALRKPIALRTVGANVDLRAIRDAISSHYFAGALPCDITFGRVARRGRRRRSVQFGVYDGVARLIRIHPLLDADWIPNFFVEFVVFHELLHAAQAPALDASGRCRHHGPRFRELERRFARYDEAIAWERAHIRQLLRSARAVEGADPSAPRQLRLRF